MEEFISHNHPSKPLKAHLEETKDIALAQVPAVLRKNGAFCKVLSDVALLHDIGKYNNHFQGSIRGDGGKEKKSIGRVPHGLISALTTYVVVKEYLKEHLKEHSPKWALVAFMSVWCHHGNLKNMKDLTNMGNWARYEAVLPSGKDFSEAAFKEIETFHQEGARVLRDLLSGRKSAKEYFGEIRELYCKDFCRKHPDKYPGYVELAALYSCLLEADKRSAMGLLEDTGPLCPPPSRLVDSYISNISQKTAVNSVRSEVYAKTVLPDTPGTKVFTLTLPTGAGKTLVGLRLALQLCERRGLKRVIYSLPWTSVLDQNHDVFKKVLGLNDGEIILHHHLSEPTGPFAVAAGEENAEEINRRYFWLEGWEGSVVCTTFYQLFHTLIGYRNSYLRRFRMLADAVVIVDEVQAFPPKYWKLLEWAVAEAAEKLNTHFIFMTATRPFLRLSNCLELAPEDYFKRSEFDRIEMWFSGEEETLGKFADRFCCSYDQSKSHMIVLNTVRSVLELYKLLRNKKLPCECLSRGHVPVHRKETIDGLRDCRGRAPAGLVLVTTQLVEAGADLDFDVVYRDIAPFDCLLQASGRCNRHGWLERGFVEVIVLTDRETGRRFAGMVYDDLLLRKTEELLCAAQRPLRSSNMRQLCENYFAGLREEVRTGEASNVLEALKQLRFSKTKETKGPAVEDFKLIEDDACRVDLFLELDDTACVAWEELERLENNSSLSPYERRALWKALMPSIRKYIVPVYKTPKNLGALSGYIEGEAFGILRVPQEYTGYVYNRQTGLRLDESSCWLF